MIQRGNNRNITFVTDEDYRFYLNCLSEAAQKHQVDIHAYVLMTNHVHLLATPHQADGIGKMMQSIGRRYVQYFNFIYKRTGTLWEGRYKSTLIDSESYLMTCTCYIELNPVRAGMLDDPAKYAWSSCKHHMGQKVDAILTDHPLYLALGTTEDGRWQAFGELLQVQIDPLTLAVIRESTNKAWILGPEKLKEEIAQLTDRRLQPLPKGRPRKATND